MVYTTISAPFVLHLHDTRLNGSAYGKFTYRRQRRNMPPKPKFTKEQMIDAAIELICEKGADRLTARELGKQLGSSSCPIFTLFKDMDEVKTEVKKRAVGVFKSYMAVAENYTPAYKKRGMQWVKFASENPRLFRLLFMQETDARSFDDAQKIIPFDKQNDIDIIMRDYNATKEQAEHLVQADVDFHLRYVFARSDESMLFHRRRNHHSSRRNFSGNDFRHQIWQQPCKACSRGEFFKRSRKNRKPPPRPFRREKIILTLKARK